ncbi:spore coat protein GerQ [Cohnella suwonensis]|uniref:Spore coat protein GerQ n=1 Tax=Cohnella suwonensis TaxID=696072 RepID=A0ABW0LYE3_9BACL
MYNKMPWPAYPQNQMMPMQQNATMPMQMPMQTPGMVQGVMTAPPLVTNGMPITPNGTIVPLPPTEESYVENILRMNLGKVATLYMTYENNSEWNAKIFKGVLEAAGRDHIIISDPVTGKRYLLLTLNLDYITFDEPLNYTLPFGTGGIGR